MQYWITAIFSLKSISQLLPAVLGIIFVWFWWSVWQGWRTPNDRNRMLENTYFFKSTSYRKLFRLHKSILVKAVTFTLAAWTCFVILTLAPPVLDGYFPARIMPWWMLPVFFAISLVVFFVVMGNQGLAIKLDKRLSISWDKGDILAIHLNHRKIRNLSPSFIRSMVTDIVSYGEKLRTHGIDSPLSIESWLLAPESPRHTPELKSFQKIINFSWLKAVSPSLRSGHIAWIMKRCVYHRKAVGKSKRATPGPLRVFTVLRVIISLQKLTAIALALLWLIFLSGFIYQRLRRLPSPELKNNHKLRNGETATKLILDAETALNELKTSQTFHLQPLKRMSTFSVIALVAYTPRVAVQLGGWVGGVRLLMPIES
jgi:hypothetical protein